MFGKLNKGQRFAVIALDLDRAFATAGFDGWELVVIQFVREHSWAASIQRKKLSRDDPWPDPDPCAIPIRPLARVLDLDHSNLCRVIRTLVRCQVLTRTPDGLFMINKTVTEWLDKKGQPRFTPERLAYVRDGIGWAQKRPAPVSQEDTTRCPTETPPRCHTRHHPGVTQDTTPVSHKTPPGVMQDTTPVSHKTPPPIVPPTPPSCESRASEDLRREKIEKKNPEERAETRACVREADEPAFDSPGPLIDPDRTRRIDELKKAVSGRRMPASQGGWTVAEWIDSQLMRCDPAGPTLEELEALVYTRILLSPRPMGPGLLRTIYQDWRDNPGTMPRVVTTPAQPAEQAATGTGGMTAAPPQIHPDRLKSWSTLRIEEFRRKALEVAEREEQA